MDSALIISSMVKSNVFLKDTLKQAGISRIVIVSTAGEARRRLIENDFPLCVVNAPLTDEFGDELACDIAIRGMHEVILIVKAEYFEEISSKVEEYGIVTVAKPMNRAFFWNALKLTQATYRNVQRMYNENKKLLQKIEDIRIVDRAKCVLISHLSMTESEAHRHIEKQAMDMRMTRRLVAEEIIKTYEK